MKKRKILIGQFSLESNTSTPVFTEYDDYIIKREKEMIEGNNVYDYFIKNGYDVIPSIAAGVTPGGTISLSAYRRISEELLSYFPSDGSLDGIWLHLHGSMNVEFIGSGESLLVSKIREKVGPNVPISIALDLHGNITYTLAGLANILCGYRTAPHVDVRETFLEAAKLLDRAIKENVLPQTKIVKIPLLLTGETAVTTVGPGKHVISRLVELDKIDGVWRSSFFTGMAWIDCPSNEAAVVVSGCDINNATVCAAMESLAMDIWSKREEFTFQDLVLTPDEALAYAKTHQDKLVFISDSGDNVTAGAVGDNAFMLELVQKSKMNNVLVGGIWDEKAVEKCAEAGIGNKINADIGGLHDSKSKRVSIEGTVKFLRRNKNGEINGAVISTENIDIIVCSIREGFIGISDFAHFDINLRDYNTIIVKQGYLFPELSNIKDMNVIALTEGNSALDITTIPYEFTHRPIYPLDKDFEFVIDKKSSCE